jgi:hypothetical protein
MNTCAEFEVLTAVIMKRPICWDITPCSPFKFILRFGTTCRPGSACYLLHAGFLLDLFFDPANGGDLFVRNSGRLSKGVHDVVSQKIVPFIKVYIN